MQNKGKKIAATALSAVLILSASLAYFTDRASGSQESKAGSICLTKVNSSHNLENMMPGDEREINYTYKNEGSLNMEVQGTYIVNVDLDETYEGEIAQYIGELKSTSGGLLPIREKDNITHTDYGLINPHKESNSYLEDTLTLKLLPDISNRYQNMTITVSVILEGKQERSEDWEILQTVDYVINGNDVKVVEESFCHSTEIEPESDGDLFETNEVWNGVTVTGLDYLYIEENLNGVIPSEINIPEKIDGKQVVEIADKAFLGRDITRLTLPEGLLKIGSGAFSYNKLTNVIIPDSVEIIEYEAFKNGTIKSVNLGKSTVMIGADAFMNNKITSVDLKNVTQIGDESFAINDLKELTLPNSLVTIGQKSFANNGGGVVKARLIEGDSWPVLRQNDFTKNIAGERNDGNVWSFEEIK